MEATSAMDGLRGRSWQRALLYPLAACSMLCIPAAAAPAGDGGSVAAKTAYRIVHLSRSPLDSVAGINARGQVAFTAFRGNVSRARFYDGSAVRDLGTLGGPSALAFALNDLGQVAGSANISADGIVSHAFRWSAATGMLAITSDPEAASSAQTINNRGELAGYATFGPRTQPVSHAYFWSPASGVIDIGTLDDSSVALAMNDAATVVGFSVTPTTVPFALRAFRWTRAGGIRDLGVPPGDYTAAHDINAAGHIVGGSPAFLWTPKRGPIYLGTGSGDRSSATRINKHGLVVGFVVRSTLYSHGFIWSRERGLFEIGRDRPGIDTSANDVNNLGQVVGAIDGRAYVWTRKDGFVDLNTRIPGAPRGLKLAAGLAVSDKGAIVAVANTGLVLLVPQCRCTPEPPVVAPPKWSGIPRAHVMLSMSADFKDADLRDTHKASWSWGDGAEDPGIVSAKSGAGSVSGQHVYRAPGIYAASLTVTDSSGRSSSVQRKVVVCGAGPCVAGEGSFMAQAAPSAPPRKGSGLATFAILGAANGDARIEFATAGIDFRSTRIDSQAIGAERLHYRGRGKVNGAGDVQFLLSATHGSGKDAFRIRIWHPGPTAGSEVVDYDNGYASRAGRSADQGAIVAEGAIAVHAE